MCLELLLKTKIANFAEISALFLFVGCLKGETIGFFQRSTNAPLFFDVLKEGGNHAIRRKNNPTPDLKIGLNVGEIPPNFYCISSSL